MVCVDEIHDCDDCYHRYDKSGFCDDCYERPVKKLKFRPQKLWQKILYPLREIILDVWWFVKYKVFRFKYPKSVLEILETINKVKKSAKK